MPSTNNTLVVTELYSEALVEHYTTKDLAAALKLYRSIIAEHGDSQEAGFCRAQIQNIVKTAVPKQELFDAEVALATHHLENNGN